MEYTILLDKGANTRDIETEEQTRFVMSVIEALEIPFEWNSNEPLSTLDKIRLRKILGQYNVSIVDDMAGNVKIYLERDKIAEFHKPRYLLREDMGQTDHRKRLFIEMKYTCESIFDDAANHQ